MTDNRAHLQALARSVAGLLERPVEVDPDEVACDAPLSRRERAVCDQCVAQATEVEAARSELLTEGLLGCALEDVHGVTRCHDVLLASWLTANPKMSLNDLWESGAGINPLIYRRAAVSVVRMLVRDHGGGKLRELVREAEERPVAQAVEAVLGRSVADIESAWLQSIRLPSRGKLRLVDVMGRVWGFWAPHKKLALALVVALAVQQLFHTLFAFGLKSIVDGLQHDSLVGLPRMVGVLALAFVVAIVGTVAGDRLTAIIGARIVNGLRRNLFMHLQRLSSDFFARTSTGTIVTRFAGELGALKQSVTKRVAASLTSLVGLVINLPILLLIDWRLGLLAAAGLPLMIGLAGRMAPRASEATYELKRSEGELANLVAENVRAHAVVRGFDLAAIATERFERQIDRVERNAIRAEFLVAMVASVSGLTVLLIQLAIVATGAYLAARGLITAGALVAFVTLLAKVAKEGYELSTKVLPEMIQAAGSIRRVEELTEELPRVVEADDAEPLPRLACEISFEHVGFTYNGDAANLRDVSLAIEAGQYVAFVGHSGSGKSTVLNLVARFYDPTVGRVLFDGIDLRRATLSSLREQLAIVFQESFLFDVSIAENIRVGKLDASQAEVEAAAKAAEIHDFIEQLPGGYDFVVGEGGGRLSGGQRQRLSIARAMIRDPAVLVLDEATSALDPKTEAAINETLAKLARGRTVISVTHRLASIQGADRIFVLKDGELAESGDHDGLLAQEGVYAELWGKQTGFEISADGRSARIDADRLGRLPVFERLEDEAMLQELVERFSSRVVPAGEVVYHAGQLVDGFYVLARGRVEMLQPDYRGGERRLRILDEGESFGVLPLLSDEPVATSVRALERCLLLTLSREHFFDLISRSPGVAAAIEEMQKQRYLEQLFGPRLQRMRRRRSFDLSAREVLGL